ncbi:MAG TPA: hypothetical protein VKU00_00760 [Chthonomonadaceae bacterium]|nr:hypothetical protein [Chthonomonadaceae bacterium]
MATQTTAPAPAEPIAPARIERTDSWQLAPLGFLLLFSAFGIWATYRAFQNGYFDTEMLNVMAFPNSMPHYLSPFYSPTVDLTMLLGWHLGPFAISPALLILPFPLSFRLSCYYYRKMIYRSYLADPLACAVAEPKPLDAMRRKKYTGERAFPFIAQNFHRYAFYAAVVFIVLLWIDTVKAFFFTNGDGTTHFGIAVGSLVFLANICLLTLYTFSCHSWRHLIGGGVDCYSCTVMNKTRHGMWQKISFLNERHGLWAMMSLCSVALTDVYVYLVTTHPSLDHHFLG